MNDPYADSFNNELPKLKTQREKDAVKAATLRFLNELRKEIIAISTKNTTTAVTGVMQVGEEPKVIADAKPNRKTLTIKNVGVVQCQVYGVSEETNGGYPLNPGEQIPVYGSNAIAVVTISGIGQVSYLDT